MTSMARFAPWNEPGQVPENGLHIVALTMIEKDGKLLFGKRLQPAWAAGKWALPFTTLVLGEPPAMAAKRVLREQLRTTSGGVRLSRILSQQDHHWDLTFIYSTEGLGDVRTSEHISELKYSDPDGIGSDELFDFHRFILEDLALRTRAEPSNYRWHIELPNNL